MAGCAVEIPVAVGFSLYLYHINVLIMIQDYGMIISMIIEIPETAAEADQLRAMAKDAGVSAARLVRGMVRVYAADAAVAQQVREVVPAAAHGGVRPGAGRPANNTNTGNPPAPEVDQSSRSERA